MSLLRRLHYLAALVFTLDARSIHPPHRIQQLHGHRTHRTVWRRRACLALPAWPRLPAGAAVLPRRRYPRPTSQPAVHSYWRDFKCDRTWDSRPSPLGMGIMLESDSDIIPLIMPLLFRLFRHFILKKRRRLFFILIYILFINKILYFNIYNIYINNL